jgi:hypothetical protein
MDEKKWWASKTIWIAIVAGVLGILSAFGVPVPEWVIAILASLGLYTARTANTEIK